MRSTSEGMMESRGGVLPSFRSCAATEIPAVPPPIITILWCSHCLPVSPDCPQTQGHKRRHSQSPREDTTNPRASHSRDGE